MEPAIDEVSFKNTISYIKEKYRKQAVFVICLNALIVFFTIYFKVEALLQLLLAIDIFILAFFYAKMKKAFMQSFAQANGYSYEEQGNIDEFKAPYLAMGHSQGATHILRGNYANCPIVLFEFNTTIGYGKHAKYITFTVFEITYKTDLRHIFLARKNGFFDTGFFEGASLESKVGRPLKLEGDFGKYFTLYVPEDYEIEALQIFTPEIMVKFIDIGNKFSFEFIDNKLFIYAKKTLNAKKDLDALYSFAKTLITDLAPRLERIK